MEQERLRLEKEKKSDSMYNVLGMKKYRYFEQDKWVDKDGKVIDTFVSFTNPMSKKITSVIEKILN